MTLTKKLRLSSGLGVSISRCARCARSNDRIVDCTCRLYSRHPRGLKPPLYARYLDLVTFARLRIPLRPVGFLLEIRARDEWLGQILRVLDGGRDDEPVSRIGVGESREVLRDDGVLAVWHAVPAQPPGQHVRGHDFQRSPAWRGGAGAPFEERVEGAAAADPFGSGIALQRSRLGGNGRRGLRLGTRSREVKQSRLLAGVGLDLQRVVILPADAQAARHTHDAADAVRLAHAVL